MRVGMFLHHKPTHATFRVLCNCGSSSPRHYTQRAIQANIGEYRLPTTSEVAPFLTSQQHTT